MRPRKPNDIARALKKKGFEEQSTKKKSHHKYYFLIYQGKKTDIYTYLSHGNSEYHKSLMDEVKKQLRFKEADLAEQFLDCPLSQLQYEDMLRVNGDLV